MGRAGGLLREREIAQGDALTEVLEWERRYDALGRLDSERSPSGSLTKYEYDPLTLRPTAVVYDAEGEALRVVIEVDWRGHLVREIDLRGVETRYDVDDAGRLTAIIEDPEGDAIRTEIAHDAAGRVIAIERDAGHGRLRARSAIEWAPVGRGWRVERVVDAEGDGASWSYDVLGRTIASVLENANDDGSHRVTRTTFLRVEDAGASGWRVTTRFHDGSIETRFDNDAGETLWQTDARGFEPSGPTTRSAGSCRPSLAPPPSQTGRRGRSAPTTSTISPTS